MKSGKKTGSCGSLSRDTYPSLPYCNKKKNIFTHAFRKKLALIILVQRLHRIITYVVCCSSLTSDIVDTVTDTFGVVREYNN